MTLWLENPEDFLHELFECFALPKDEERFKNITTEELICANAIHHARVSIPIPHTPYIYHHSILILNQMHYLVI